MTDIVVEVNHLWKKFHRGEIHHSLRDLVPALAKRIAGRGPKRDELAKSDFWVLKDVSFQVKQGEVLGIVGSNGAGKSTLLKILSKIIKQDRGRMKVNGRLRALLEVAAGFHPDLTGRENVYLNGSILGMKRAEIASKFDEIVDFSGIEEALDTPVKRYSSGMQARLGFAVAAHLDPEVLIVDEVLAVGDVEFQKRCLGKMQNVASSGRTVLFVSHNMAAVQSLCTKCLVLGDGVIVFEGPSPEAIAQYVGMTSRQTDTDLSSRTDRRGAGDVYFTSLAFLGENDAPTDTVAMGTPLRIRAKLKVLRPIRQPTIALVFHTASGQRLFRLHTGDVGCSIGEVSEDLTVNISTAALALLPGSYPVTLSVLDGVGALQDQIDNAAVLEVNAADVLGTGKIPCGPGDLIYLPASWSVSR